MLTKVQRWGNSLGVRLSKPLAEEVCLRNGTVVEVRCEGGRLVIVPLKTRRRFRLHDLLSGVTPGNRHAEIGTGAPVGRESW